MTISIDHLHSRSPERKVAANVCPGGSVVRFVPCRVSGTPELVDGKVSICVQDNLPKPGRKMSTGSGWVLSDKVFFTDGREIFIGWFKRPTKGLLESGRTPFWETCDGRILNEGEVKGWQSLNRIQITIDR